MRTPPPTLALPCSARASPSFPTPQKAWGAAGDVLWHRATLLTSHTANHPRPGFRRHHRHRRHRQRCQLAWHSVAWLRARLKERDKRQQESGRPGRCAHEKDTRMHGYVPVPQRLHLRRLAKFMLPHSWFGQSQSGGPARPRPRPPPRPASDDVHRSKGCAQQQWTREKRRKRDGGEERGRREGTHAHTHTHTRTHTHSHTHTHAHTHTHTHTQIGLFCCFPPSLHVPPPSFFFRR